MRLTPRIQTLQEFADAADGENVLVVSHMDGVSASVSRYMPWALLYPVKHTGFTVSYREKYAGATTLMTAADMLRVQSLQSLPTSHLAECKRTLKFPPWLPDLLKADLINGSGFTIGLPIIPLPCTIG